MNEYFRRKADPSVEEALGKEASLNGERSTQSATVPA
jgi:hypothetical protein